MAGLTIVASGLAKLAELAAMEETVVEAGEVVAVAVKIAMSLVVRIRQAMAAAAAAQVVAVAVAAEAGVRVAAPSVSCFSIQMVS